MPDAFDELYAGGTTDEDEGGLWSSFKSVYDKFDQDWLPEFVTGSNDPRFQAALEKTRQVPVIGRPLSGLVETMQNVQGSVRNALVGSPIRAAGTAATLATGPFGVAARLGAAAKPIGVVARGIDAVEATRSGGRAVEEFQQGNTGSAVGSAVGAGLLGVGATLPVGRRISRPPRPVINEAPRQVTREIPPNTLNVSRELPPPVEPVIRQQTLASGQPGPTQFSRTVIRNIPKGELTEGTIPLTNQMRGAPGVALNAGQEQLADRAARELTALEIPVTAKNINKYINDTEFRRNLQRQAEIRGASQRYESTDGTKYVQEAPVPIARPKDVTVQDVRNELAKRGVANASDEFVARIRKDTALQEKMGMRELFMEGVEMPPNQVKGYLTIGTTKVPVPEPVQPGLFQPDDLPDVKIEKLSQSPTLPPEVKQAAEQISRARKTGPIENALRGVASSIESELESKGEVGKQIARLLKVADTDAGIRFNKYVESTIDSVKSADQKTFEQAVDYIEGNLPNPSAKVKELGDKLKKSLDLSGADLEETGLLEKGVRQNYFPRSYEGVPDKTIREAMRANGMSEDEIAKNIELIRKNREMKISAEYSRNDLNVPGYRKDKDVYIDHMRDVAKRVEMARNFGPKDLADPNSPISKMIAASEDPARVRDLVQRAIRGGREVSEPNQWVSRKIREYATAAHLSLASISNLGGVLPIAVRGTISDTMSGLAKAFNTELSDMKFMNNVNLYRSFSGGFSEVIGDKSKLYKAFGIEGTQNYLNRVAGATGHAYAKTLFEAVKSNPDNERAMKQLSDLVLDGGETLLKQDELTDKQLQRAMVRMAEITQGVNENRKLPYHWVRNGIATVPQIFMRTSFQTSKAMYDAVKQDPVRNAPKLIALGLAVGEIVGDVKEAAKTGAQVGMNSLQQMAGITEEDKNFTDEYLNNIGVRKGESDAIDRFSFTRKWLREIDPELAKNDLAVRAVANLEQSFALGLPSDVLRSLSDAWGDRDPLNKAMSLFWFWDEGQTAVRQLYNLGTGNLRDVGRETVKRVPFVGRGAAREIESRAQVRRGEQSTGNIRGAAW